MEYQLSPAELRVVGSLVEKEITTPEYYPLTLNALVNACNQKSNRDPVMNLTDKEVENIIEDLRESRLVWQMSLAGSRVPKYEHNLRSLFQFSDQEIALLCVLMLRGPQTVGELRTRTERMARFSSTEEVESVLKGLAEKETPLVLELSRKPGQKESRFVQLFSEPPTEDSAEIPGDLVVTEPGEGTVRLSDRVSMLEAEVGKMREEMAELRTELKEFRKQFE